MAVCARAAGGAGSDSVGFATAAAAPAAALATCIGAFGISILYAVQRLERRIQRMQRPIGPGLRKAML